MLHGPGQERSDEKRQIVGLECVPLSPRNMYRAQWSRIEKNTDKITIIHFPTSEGVSELSERVNERTQRSPRAKRASEGVSNASKRVNGRASSDRSGPFCCSKQKPAKHGNSVRRENSESEILF